MLGEIYDLFFTVIWMAVGIFGIFVVYLFFAAVGAAINMVWTRFREQRQGFNLSLIHISEPTRRVVISYAVFCLKKKKEC